MSIILKFIKKNVVMCIALLAAIITSFIVPPDKEYLGYFDIKTLVCLFCVLAVVCALKNIGFFYSLAREIVRKFKNIRSCVVVLVCITFIGSMFIANDMALLTFLPLGYLILSVTKEEGYMAFTFIMQNIAANLGGMLTPFGNPQNLYLYSKFNIPTDKFMLIMLPPFLISITLIFACCFIFVKKESIEIGEEKIQLPKIKTVIYLLLFAIAIAIVFRGIPYWVGLAIIPITIFFMDKNALRSVDYPLLFTFVFFFVFAGNMGRISAVRNVFAFLLEKNTLLFSVLSCQVISNVPSAILLSQFTENYVPLLVGVNIGGVGTLIASLASLITFREYTSHFSNRIGRYVGMFSIFNFGFLIVLTGIMLIIL